MQFIFYLSKHKWSSTPLFMVIVHFKADNDFSLVTMSRFVLQSSDMCAFSTFTVQRCYHPSCEANIYLNEFKCFFPDTFTNCKSTTFTFSSRRWSLTLTSPKTVMLITSSVHLECICEHVHIFLFYLNWLTEKYSIGLKKCIDGLFVVVLLGHLTLHRHRQRAGKEGQVLHRSKRGWVWNQFFVIEEYTGPDPVLVGRVSIIKHELIKPSYINFSWVKHNESLNNNYCLTNSQTPLHLQSWWGHAGWGQMINSNRS